jgi:hypothetical protein
VAVGEAEAAATRQWRLRQLEDFFSASGFASPDDTAVFEAGQQGFGAQTFEWLDGFSRGAAIASAEPNAQARELGIKPALSVNGRFTLNQETQHRAPYREWARLMKAGFEADRARGAA